MVLCELEEEQREKLESGEVSQRRWQPQRRWQTEDWLLIQESSKTNQDVLHGDAEFKVNKFIICKLFYRSFILRKFTVTCVNVCLHKHVCFSFKVPITKHLRDHHFNGLWNKLHPGQSEESPTWPRLFLFSMEWEPKMCFKFSYKEKNVTFIVYLQVWARLNVYQFPTWKNWAGQGPFPVFMPSAICPTRGRICFHPYWNNIDDPCRVLTHKRSWCGSMTLEVNINPEAALLELWPFNGYCLKVIGWTATS